MKGTCMERNRLLILLLGGYLCLGGVSPVFGQIFVTTALRYNSCSDNDSGRDCLQGKRVCAESGNGL
jgi:hypothetical protein